MNKKEVIEEIKKQSVQAYDDFAIMRDTAIYIVNQLNEPEKPVVPQFVADFYESIKDDFEDKVYDLCVQFNFDESELNSDVAGWFGHSKNKPIETLVLMHKFGYEIEKEKLYIARNKTTGEHLYFNNAKKRFESGSLLTSYVKNIKAYHHTQDKLEKLNYWGNSLFEFEEVEE